VRRDAGWVWTLFTAADTRFIHGDTVVEERKGDGESGVEWKHRNEVWRSVVLFNTPQTITRSYAYTLLFLFFLSYLSTLIHLYIYIYPHTHTHIYTHIHMHLYVYLSIHVREYILEGSLMRDVYADCCIRGMEHGRTQPSFFLFFYTRRIFLGIFTFCLCVYVSIYLSIYVSIYLYIYVCVCVCACTWCVRTIRTLLLFFLLLQICSVGYLSICLNTSPNGDGGRKQKGHVKLFVLSLFSLLHPLLLFIIINE